MREIKFRGRRSDKLGKGEWVYGSLLRLPNRTFSIMTHDTGATYEVDPETVGQLTGHKDKNGVEIWEGDLLRTPAEADEPAGAPLYVVGWHEKRCEWECTYNYGQSSFNRHVQLHMAVSSERQVDAQGNFTNPKPVAEVVGNIYENSERLNQKEVA